MINKKTIMIIPAILFVITVILLILNTNKIDNEMNQSEFNGVIDSIEYTRQMFPYLFIDGKKYYSQDYTNKQGYKFEVGDSVINQ